MSGRVSFVRLTRLLVLAAAVVWLAAPHAAHALPLSESAFRGKIESAISTVTAAQSSIASAGIAAKVAMDVEMLLPLGLEVAENTSTVTVADVATVHLLTERLRSAGSGDARSEAADRLKDHLLSMRAALGSSGGDHPWDARALAALLKERPVTTDSGQNWLNEQLLKVLEAVTRWLDALFGGGSAASAGGLSRLLQYVVVLVPVIVAIWILARTVRRRKQQAAASPEMPAGENGQPVVAAAADLPDDPLEYARLLERQGQHREALRVLYGGAARHLVESGLVARMRTRTNHEMLRDVARSAPALAPSFERLTDDFERAWYGHADPGATGLVSAMGVYEELVTDAPAASAPATGGAATRLGGDAR